MVRGGHRKKKPNRDPQYPCRSLTREEIESLEGAYTPPLSCTEIHAIKAAPYPDRSHVKVHKNFKQKGNK